MKFCNFETVTHHMCVGVCMGDRVLPLHELLQSHKTTVTTELEVSTPATTLSSENISFLNHYMNAVRSLDEEDYEQVPRYPLEEIRFLPPVAPISSFRDFYAFEQHVKTVRQGWEAEMIPEWYEIPVFYFSNHHAMISHQEDLPFPPAGEWLDYELEVAAIIGFPGQDIPAEEADQYIAGYTILNDWSLRDAQTQEMKVNLGPAKGKDFATSLGPYLVTPDELQDRHNGKGYDLKMVARVNGKEYSCGNWKDIYYSFGEMIARASQGVTLNPGDVIGSGTVGTGCILELGPENVGGWLKPDDLVELEIEDLGVLKNRIRPPQQEGIGKTSGTRPTFMPSAGSR